MFFPHQTANKGKFVGKAIVLTLNLMFSKINDKTIPF